MTQTTVTVLCRQDGFESLFWDEDSSHPLRLIHEETNAKKRKTVEVHIEMLTETQENENEFFWQEAAPSNLLAFLHLIIDEDEEALKQLKLTLEHYPNNLNAILGKIRILELQYHKSEAEKMLKQKYSKLKEDGREMQKQKNICQGEMAYACSYIDPDFYIHAIDRYESLLDPESEVWTIKDELYGYIVRWRYYLAYAYNRMLNKGYEVQLTEKLDTKDMRAIFDKISKLYTMVIASEDPFHKGRAMIDLVDAHKKCETSGNYREIPFPYRCGPDQFVRDAMTAAPNDPYVLGKCGRHYRQRARSKEDFDETVEIFDRVLHLYPTKHVAWHHKGLACRALWHITGNYREAKLYQNSARTGNKKQFRKSKHKSTKYRVQTQSWQTEAASASAAECQNNCSSVSVPHPDGYERDSVQLRMSANEQATNMPDIVSSTTQKTPTPQTPPKELPTILRWNHSHQLEDVPKQTKKPDFFDKLRTNNPAAVQNKSPSYGYLQQAKDCFQRATKITKGTCGRYVVDFARALISLGLFDKAERQFNKANKPACAMNNNDATYFYEQWALLRHDRASREKTPDDDRGQMKDVARLYRQAILSAVRARCRSRIAFYKLGDLLLSELQHDPENRALLMEYDVMYNSVEKYSKCKDKHVLVEALKQDEQTREVAWKMIELLHGRHHPDDAAIAFMYLTALHEADQLHLEDSTAPTNSHRSTKLLLLDVVSQLVSGDQTNADAGQTFGEVFRWMIGTRRISDHIKLDLNISRKGEICVLAPSKATPGVSTVQLTVLQKMYGISVVTAFSDGNCDVPFGVPTSEGLRAVVANSQAVVVVEDSTDTVNWNMLFPVLEELMRIKDAKVCFVADENTDCSNTEQRYIQRWPRIAITEDTHVLAYKLLKAMFCKSD